MDISNVASTAIGIILPYLKEIGTSVAQDLKEGSTGFLKKKISDLFKSKASTKSNEELEKVASAPTEENLKVLQDTIEKDLNANTEFLAALKILINKIDPSIINQKADTSAINQSINIGGDVGKSFVAGTVNGGVSL